MTEDQGHAGLVYTHRNTQHARSEGNCGVESSFTFSFLSEVHVHVGELLAFGSCSYLATLFLGVYLFFLWNIYLHVVLNKSTYMTVEGQVAILCKEKVRNCNRIFNMLKSIARYKQPNLAHIVTF